MKYKYILFDADDTLFDFDATMKIALQQTFAYYKLSFSDEIIPAYTAINERCWSLFSQGKISKKQLLTERFKQLFESLSISNVNLTDISRSYLNFLGCCSVPMSDAVELCSKLCRQATLAVVTNGFLITQKARFEQSEITQYLKYIFISEEIGCEKPHSGIFNHVFSEMNIESKSNTLIVGDSLSTDIKGGADFGIDTCWFNPRRLANDSELIPTYEISNLLEILNLK